jgi:hypothetical protein
MFMIHLYTSNTLSGYITVIPRIKCLMELLKHHVSNLPLTHKNPKNIIRVLYINKKQYVHNVLTNFPFNPMRWLSKTWFAG